MKNLLLLLIFGLASASLLGQELQLPSQLQNTPDPYYVWKQNDGQRQEMLGVLYKVEKDSFYTISKNTFFDLERRFLNYPNSVSRNFLDAYPINNTQLKGYRKGRVYFYAILGTVAGAGVAVADVVQSHRKCNRDFFCNTSRERNRRFTDLSVVGIGAGAGLVTGIVVGSIKIKIPLNDYPRVRRYTLFQELL
ncbi:MAG: hypothetical protein AAGG68_14345 [Bacteroidota bacterium]